MMRRKSEASRQAYVGSPQLIRAGSHTEAAIAQSGARVITEIGCPHLPPVISQKAKQFRWHIIKIR